MVCKKCGAQNKDYFVYCKECSALLIDDEPAPVEETSAPSSQYDEGYSSGIRIQPVFESRRPSVSAFKENARKQAEASDTVASRSRPSESLYDAPSDYSSKDDSYEYDAPQYGAAPRSGDPSQGRTYREGFADDRRVQRADLYEDRIRDVLTQYELRKTSEEPYYDPKERHKALDPWELLDDETQNPQAAEPPRREEPPRARAAQPPAVGRERADYTPSVYGDRFIERQTGIPAEGRQAPKSDARPAERDRYTADAPARRVYIPEEPQRMAPNRGSSEGRSAAEAPAGARNGGRRAQVDHDEDIPLEKPTIEQLRREFQKPEPLTQSAPKTREELQPPTAKKAPKKHVSKKQDDREEFDAYDPADEEPEYDRRRRRDDGEPVEKRSRLFTVLFWVVIAALVCTIVWYGISYVNDEYGSVKDALSALFGGKSATTERNPPVIEETEYDGKPAHTIIVAGRDGEQVYFKDLDKTFPITGGAAKLKVVDLNWIPEEPAADQDEMTVTPQVIIIDKRGNEIPLESPSFTVKVPTVPFTLNEPAQTNGLVLDKAELVIAGTVTAGSHTRVFVDDNEITDIVNDQGAFSYQATLPGHGDYTINVTAKLPRYKSVTVPISVSYPRKEVDVQFTDVPARTEESKLTVKGTMEAGATITVDGSVEGDVTVDSAAGTFSFVAKLGNYGRNEYKVTATAEGVTTLKELLVIRTPSMEEYTAKAVALDYAALSKDPVKLKGTIYRFEGKVKSIISTDPTTIVIFNVGTDSNEKLLKLEYFGTSEMKEGASYRVFGGVLGKDDEQNIPFLSAHFVYKP